MYTHVPFQRYDVTEFDIHEMLMSRDVTVVFVNKDQLSLIKGPQNAFFYTTNADKKGVLTFPGLLDIALQFRTLVMKKREIAEVGL